MLDDDVVELVVERLTLRALRPAYRRHPGESGERERVGINRPTRQCDGLINRSSCCDLPDKRHRWTRQIRIQLGEDDFAEIEGCTISAGESCCGKRAIIKDAAAADGPCAANNRPVPIGTAARKTVVTLSEATCPG